MDNVMSEQVPGTDDWYAQVVEDVLEPELEIVDPHHHLWPVDGAFPYGKDELVGDTGSGHNVVQTVFVECRAGYRTEGLEEFLPVGETEFVTGEARAGRPNPIAGIVAKADLRLVNLDDVLDAHQAASDGLFRGIRDALALAKYPEELMIPGSAPEGLFQNAAFRAGVHRLGERGLTYDSWHYHHQNQEFLELARAVPETTMVLDHFGTPLGVGAFADSREEIFEQWRRDITEIATCENVVAKIGGLAMPDNGFGWHTAARPPTSDEFLEVQARYYLHTIEAFGPERCMFESNFPVDRLSLSYTTVWNAFKKLTKDFSSAERSAMFAGTARRIYRL